MNFLLWRRGKKDPKSERPIAKILAEIEGLIEECQSVSDEELALLEGKPRVIVVRQGFRSGSVIALSVISLLVGVGLGFWFGWSNRSVVVVPQAGEIDKRMPMPLTAPVAPEAATVAPVPNPPVASVPVSQPSGLDSLALETQALKKRVQDMK